MKNIATHVTCEDIEGNTYTVPVNELSFRPTVYAIIVKNNTILLSKQWQGYDFPGGGVELSESLEEALIREVKEETGLHIAVKDIIHCATSFFKLPFKDKYVQTIHHFYTCEVVSGNISTEYFDEQEKKYAEEAVWLPLENIKKVKIYTPADLAVILKDYL